jgi:hypothetical protein
VHYPQLIGAGGDSVDKKSPAGAGQGYPWRLCEYRQNMRPGARVPLAQKMKTVSRSEADA